MTLLTLEEAGAAALERIGGKARGLSRLAALDLPVPPAVVLDASAHAAFARDGALGAATAEAVVAAARPLGWPLAVRSSAADEDAGDKSAAGQYESVMGVGDPAQLLAAIERCYRAADSERAQAYRGVSPTHPAEVALVIQREVAAQRAGVAFSVNPVTGAGHEIVIEAVFGHGEGLVSGELDPDRFWVAREGGGVRARRSAKPTAADGRGGVHPLAPERRWARVLLDSEARRVAELVVTAERGFGAPVDVEFCWSLEDLWLVQCRPITTLRAAA